MSTVQNTITLYKNQIDSYHKKVNSNTMTASDYSEAKNVVVNYYTYLENQGIEYGELGRITASESDFSGHFANTMLRNGIERANPSFTDEQAEALRDDIMINLAFRDSSLRSSSLLTDGRILTKNIAYTESSEYDHIAEYHYSVFEEFGLER